MWASGPICFLFPIRVGSYASQQHALPWKVALDLVRSGMFQAGSLQVPKRTKRVLLSCCQEPVSLIINPVRVDEIVRRSFGIGRFDQEKTTIHKANVAGPQHPLYGVDGLAMLIASVTAV